MSIENAEDDSADGRSAPAPRLGLAAAVIAALLAVLVAIAVGVASNGDHASGTVLAWVVIVGTALTFLLGAAAIALDRGRRWGAVAVILSLLANPWILTQILSFFGALAVS